MTASDPPASPSCADAPPGGGRPGSRPSPATWLRRLGVAGFLFFLMKGLLWLIVPAVLVTLGIDCGSP